MILQYPRPAAAIARWLLVAAALVGSSCRRPGAPAPVAEMPPVITTKSGAEMVLIPAGRFTMGSPGGQADEAPAHEVQVDALLIDRYEVTQEQYGKLVLGNPSHFKGPTRPMEQVSWAEAALYCNLRSRAEGLEPCYNEATAECNYRANGYRLPTEAEWEYACRAGTSGDYHFGADARLLDQYAWYAGNSSKQTHPVGQKKPNPWGLFDIYGNVAEWCNDMYQANFYEVSPDSNPRGPAEGERYVLRGGAWNCTPKACRSAARAGEDPGFQDACFARDAIGFRCVRKAPQNSLQPDPQDPPDEQRPPGTGFVYGDLYLRHQTGDYHPESPERLTAIVQRLKATGLLPQLMMIQPAPAPRQWLTMVHTGEYVDRVEASCRQRAEYLDSRDTPVCRESYSVALAAAGGVLAAVDAVMEGKVRNAFCAVRPPGHHALKDRAMGFCLFNNVAIAARYVQHKHKLSKVLIVDWDVHHGNGTQAAFYDDPSVLYFSVHQFPFYPGTGSASEKGSGKGLNYTINVPLPAGSGDREVQKAFAETLTPAAGAFHPDFVLISAGFDAHRDDPIGGMKVTAEGFAKQTQVVKQIAEQYCKGRLVSVLEGGYGLEGLAASVEAHVRVLMQ